MEVEDVGGAKTICKKKKKKKTDVLEENATRCMNTDADDGGDFNEEKSNNMEKEVKVVDESSTSLLFRERIK
jgi:hypothetical protein